jgi:hypothetical protein
MYEQNERARHFGIGRTRQVTNQVEAIARADCHRPHRHQRGTGQLRSRVVELAQRLGLTLIQVRHGGFDIGSSTHNPQPVILGTADYGPIPDVLRREKVEIGLDARLERDVLGALDIHRVGDRFLCEDIGDGPPDIRTRIGGQNAEGSGREFEAGEHCGVATSAVAQEERGPVGVQVRRPRIARVLRAEACPIRPTPVRRMAQYVERAVPAVFRGEAGAVVIVYDKRREATVFFDQHQLAADDMQRVEIKVFGVAPIQMDQHVLTTDAAYRGDPCPNAVKWGEVSGNPVERVNHENMKVLIAIDVLQIEQMVRAVVGPAVDTDAALAIIGDDLGPFRRLRRSDPDVQHAVNRGKPGQKPTIGADLGVGPGRIAE